MSKITLTATLTAAEGKADELEAALVALIAAADEEPGLEVYSASKSKDDPNVFVFFEVYRDAEALEVHGKGDGMKAAMGAMGGLLAGRPDVKLMDPVAAKGLEF